MILVQMKRIAVLLLIPGAAHAVASDTRHLLLGVLRRKLHHSYMIVLVRLRGSHTETEHHKPTLEGSKKQ